MSCGNLTNALPSSPLSRTSLEQRLIEDEPPLDKCLLRGISRKSLKSVRNCSLQDIRLLTPVSISSVLLMLQ